MGHVGAQFFGAFNDNLFKQLILFLAARQLFPGEDKQGLAFAVFALPFILLSGFAGDLSERLSKSRIIFWMKVAEIGIMLIGAVALQTRSWPLMLAVLFIMGAQSAIFGPAKYGVIPELVGKAQLLPANGLITMTTFLAILFGQAVAGPLLDGFGDRLWITGAWCAAFAALGTGLAALIKTLAPQRPETRLHFNPVGSVWASIKELRADARVLPLLLLNSCFWFNGGVLQQAITGLGAPAYLDIPPGQHWRVSLLLVILALAIIVGSVAVPALAKRVRPGILIVMGAFGMLLGQWAITVASSGWLGAGGAYLAVACLLPLVGFGGALFVVPVQTFLQDAPGAGTRGKAFAVNNFLNFIFIFLAGIYYMGTTALHFHPGAAAGMAGLGLCGYLWLIKDKVLSINRPS